MEAVGALASLRVVEFGELASAPYCARLLADAGAEVIKVERPPSGDPARLRGPFPQDLPDPEQSGLFLALNTNKLGVTLNVTTATGRKLARELLRNADVCVENLPYGVLASCGLDYESLRQEQASLIYCSLSPYGRTGPLAEVRGFDINSASLGGITEQHGIKPREPLAPPFEQSGYQAGLAAASAILVALFERGVSGEGQYIDIAESDVWATTQTGMEYLTYAVDGVGSIRDRPRGRRSPAVFPPPRWVTRDGVLIGGMAQVAQFERFLAAIGRPEWVEDPRFANRNNLPMDAAEELRAASDAWFSAHSNEQALEVLLAHKLPFTPLNTIAELVESPQTASRSFLATPPWPQPEPWRYPTESFLMSASPTSLRTPAPMLGEHNAPIICDRLGYSRDELVSMFQTGVI